MPLEIRNPASFPRLLGLTEPGICPIGNTPELKITTGAGNTAWLESVQECAFPEPDAHCAGAQDVDYGTVSVDFDQDLLTWPDGAPNEYLAAMKIWVADIKKAPYGPVERKIVLRIGTEDAEMLRLTESEHTQDQRHAFAITVDHLVTSINKVAEAWVTGTTPDEAKTTLLRKLAATAGDVFVPADPYDPEQWRERVAWVYGLACNRTGRRDADGGNHKATWWADFESGDTLLIYPQLPGPGPTSQDLIILDEIPLETPDWTVPPATVQPATVPPATRAWKVGNSVLPTTRWADEWVEVFTDDTFAGTPWLTLTFGQIYDDTYDVTPMVDLLVVELVDDDGYVIQTRLTDPDSTSDPKERKDCYFRVREEHLR